MLQQFAGASVRRVIDRSDSHVPEHAHDWPVLSIFVLGGYVNETEVGGARIQGPSVIFYRAGAAHCNSIGPVGFEQIEIEFDADWLGRAWIPELPVTRWLGGQTGSEARELGRACTGETDEQGLRAALRRFVQGASHRYPVEPAPWMTAVQARLQENPTLGVGELARDVKRHPSWLGTAYRTFMGEGLRETAARYRAERAVCALRETRDSYASIAQTAGFCDQSHMNRILRRLLDRTPSQLREDCAEFRREDRVCVGGLRGA